MTEKTAETIARGVAHALGGVFRLRSENGSECYGVIELPDGVTFWAHVDGYGHKDRIRFSALYPKHEDGRGNGLQSTTQRDFDRGVPYDRPALGEITCSKFKSSEQLAKDVENRFLKFYRPLFAKALEYCAAQVAYHGKLDANKKAVAAALDGLGRYDSGHAWRVEVQNVWADSVDLSVRGLTVDQVEKLAALLRTF
jgi:hypothetical protein